ncbi:hypothetical protein [Modestobacter lapidis]|nr:hypothetical protein [Modestobacter lapidis]
MNAPPALATRSSSPVVSLPADEELDLAALLDLFTAEDAEEHPAAAPPVRRSARSAGAALHAWAQELLRRAIGWGAGPGGVWRAW